MSKSSKANKIKSSKRENQSATTFWMDNDTKSKAQDIARRMNVTLTDLINNAVDLYLKEGIKLETDDEKRQKLTAASLMRDLTETSMVSDRIEDISEDMISIKARLKEVENSLTSKQDRYEKDVGNIVQAEIRSKVTPILLRLGQLMDRLSPSEEEQILEE